MTSLEESTGTPRIGLSVYTADGEVLGHVTELHRDELSGDVEWVGVRRGSTGEALLVPSRGSTVADDSLRLAYDAEVVTASAGRVPRGIRSDEDERELFDSYGLDYPGRTFEWERIDDVIAEEEDRFADVQVDGEAEFETEGVVLHEEQVEVTPTPVTSRVRLRKVVDEAPASASVELQQETARIERHPVDRIATTGEIGEGEIEVVLRGERPVVTTRTVAREEVRLEKDVVTEHALVEDTVRVERAEVVIDDAPRDDEVGRRDPAG